MARLSNITSSIATTVVGPDSFTVVCLSFSYCNPSKSGDQIPSSKAKHERLLVEGDSSTSYSTVVIFYSANESQVHSGKTNYFAGGMELGVKEKAVEAKLAILVSNENVSVATNYQMILGERRKTRLETGDSEAF